MACKLYGQVNIELLGTKETEIVLEGNLSAESLKGQIDIYLDGAQKIFLDYDKVAYEDSSISLKGEFEKNKTQICLKRSTNPF